MALTSLVSFGERGTLYDYPRPRDACAIVRIDHAAAPAAATRGRVGEGDGGAYRRVRRRGVRCVSRTPRPHGRCGEREASKKDPNHHRGRGQNEREPSQRARRSDGLSIAGLGAGQIPRDVRHITRACEEVTSPPVGVDEGIGKVATRRALPPSSDAAPAMAKALPPSSRHIRGDHAGWGAGGTRHARRSALSPPLEGRSAILGGSDGQSPLRGCGHSDVDARAPLDLHCVRTRPEVLAALKGDPELSRPRRSELVGVDHHAYAPPRIGHAPSRADSPASLDNMSGIPGVGVVTPSFSRSRPWPPGSRFLHRAKGHAPGDRSGA